MSRYNLEQIKTLPENVQDAFFNAEEKFIFEIEPELPVSEQAEVVKDLMFDVFFGTLKAADLAAAVAKVVPDAEVAKEVTVKILGLAILPMADYFGVDVLALMENLGGDSLLYRRHVPVHDIVKTLLEKTKIVIVEDRLIERLCKIIESRLFNIRTDEQALMLLTGNVKTSGMGLSDDQAATLLATFFEERRLIEQRGIIVLSDRKYEDLPPAETDLHEPIIAETVAPPPNLPLAVGETPLPTPPPPEPPPPPRPLTDEEEISLMAKKMRDRAHMSVSASTGDVAQAVNASVERLKLTWPDESMTARFRGIVDLYFRDLRDALETKSKMTMTVASGGLAVPDVEADRILDALAADLRVFRGQAESVVGADRTKFVEAQMSRQQNAANQEAAQEQRVLDSRFGDLQRRAKGEPESPVVLNTATKIIPVVPGVAPESTSSAVAPSSSSASVADAQNSVNRPAVTDVRSTPRLVGPIEELRALTLVDFRRLSRDPAEATLKIRDKIDLLGEQSFEMKALGIKGWQDSEPNRLYLDTLRQSLDGVPMAEVLATREAKGLPALAKNEFDAIMELNRKLRFG